MVTEMTGAELIEQVMRELPKGPPLGPLEVYPRPGDLLISESGVVHEIAVHDRGCLYELTSGRILDVHRMLIKGKWRLVCHPDESLRRDAREHAAKVRAHDAYYGLSNAANDRAALLETAVRR